MHVPTPVTHLCFALLALGSRGHVTSEWKLFCNMVAVVADSKQQQWNLFAFPAMNVDWWCSKGTEILASAPLQYLRIFISVLPSLSAMLAVSRLTRYWFSIYSCSID